MWHSPTPPTPARAWRPSPSAEQPRSRARSSHGEVAPRQSLRDVGREPRYWARDSAPRRPRRSQRGDYRQDRRATSEAATRDTRAYLLAGYASFNAYLEGRWEMSRRQAFRILAATAVVHELVPTLAPVPLPTLTQAEELARFEPAERHALLDSLERPLSDYSTRELQRRARAFQ